MQQTGGSCIVTRETLEDFSACWSSAGAGLKWSCLFMLPPWIEPWLEHFGGTGQPRIYKITEAGVLLGFAPLLVQGDEASLIGSPDVCDYLDFIVAPDRQDDFFQPLSPTCGSRALRPLTSGRCGPTRQHRCILAPGAAARRKISPMSLCCRRAGTAI